MNASLIYYSVGAVLILIGIFVSSPALIATLRTIPPNLAEQLLAGATLFRIGLVSLGIVLIVLGRAFIGKLELQSRHPRSESRPKIQIPTSLVIILFAALALRLYKLNAGLWYDEILTYVHYARLPFGQIITTYGDQNQHFLYSILAHASFLIFGESGWSLRLPAVIFGTGSIWALYLFGRQVTNAREALLSAALLTFSYHHVWFSQNGRGYTALLFWTILSSWLLLRGIRETKPKLWVLYALAVALGVYTHMTMLFVITAHFIIYLIEVLTRRKEMWPYRWSGFFLGFCLAGVLTLLLYALVMPQLFGGTFWEGARLTIIPWKNPFWTFVELVNGIEIGFAAPVVGLLVFGGGLLSFGRKDPMVILLLILPALVSAAVFIAMGHPLWPRTFFFTIGFGILIIIRGGMLWGDLAAKLAHLGPTKSIPSGTVLCVGLILISAMSILSAYGPKQDYLGALTFVNERRGQRDAVVTVGIPATFPYRHFYKANWEAVETLQDLNSARSRTGRTWLLYTMPLYVQSEYPEILVSIHRDFKVVQKFNGTLGGGTIFVCLSDLPPV